MSSSLARPRVKICCIASRQEAQLAIAHGANALGLVSAMPSGPGVIADSLISEIAAGIPPGVASFLLTSQESAAEIIAQQRTSRVNTLQICDRLPRGSHAELRAALPGVALVQVIHVTGEESVDEALEIAPEVDALLLDSGNPKAAVKELGGTGRVHDWSLSRQIRERAGRPVFLAGGLRPDNVGEAIRIVRPYAVDVCTGVRSAGRLEIAKLAAFMSAVAAGQGQERGAR